MFRTMMLCSLGPVLLMTHLPSLPFLAIVLLFPFFTVAMTGRIVPLQALLIKVPRPASRGAFLSVNSSFQSLGGGCGAWLGGVLLSSASDGTITGFGTNGSVAAALALCVVYWVGRVTNDANVVGATDRPATV
jgi:DHA1 family inner membrane transport protein